jgi:hypothetical protein
MKKTVMKKWVKALRSGKFKQTKNRLKRTNDQGKVSHCCLGVLCELYNDEMIKNKKEKLKETTQSSAYDKEQMTHSFDGIDDILPKKVMNWSGLGTEEGEFDATNPTTTKPLKLTEMNDDGKRFTTIANFIEKNWENL